jgi:hypothetical protein
MKLLMANDKNTTVNYVTSTNGGPTPSPYVAIIKNRNNIKNTNVAVIHNPLIYQTKGTIIPVINPPISTPCPILPSWLSLTIPTGLGVLLSTPYLNPQVHFNESLIERKSKREYNHRGIALNFHF